MKTKQPEMKTDSSIFPANISLPTAKAVSIATVTVTAKAAATNALKTNIQTYQDMKGHLVEYYDMFKLNPESIGVEPTLAAQIKSMNPLQAKGLWLLFKQQFKLKLSELDKNDLANLLNQDLTEDGVTIASKEALKMLFKNPENPDYHLEQEMIGTIKAMSASDKDALMQATASLDHIALNESAGHKILAFIKGLWVGLEPVFEKISTILVTKGVTGLEHISNQELPPEVAVIINTELESIEKQSVEVATQTVGALIDDGLNGTSALDTVKASATTISVTIGNTAADATQKIVAAKTDEVFKLIEAQLGVGNLFLGAHVEQPAISLSGDSSSLAVDHHA